MKIKNIKLYSLSVLALITTSSVDASILYTYTGNNFIDTYGNYNTSMTIMGSMEFSSALGSNLSNENVSPLQFSFNDGLTTINNSNLWNDNSYFRVSTNSSGNIVDWNIYLHTPIEDPMFAGATTEGIRTSSYGDSGWIITCTAMRDGGCISGPTTDYGSTVNPVYDPTDPPYVSGVWSVTPVPLPAAIWLFGAGFLSLLSLSKKSR